jgi:hypothetical protein
MIDVIKYFSPAVIAAILVITGNWDLALVVLAIQFTML